MLKNRCIIIFGDDWGRYPSTIQHLGKVFAKENTLIWIGSLGLRKPSLRWNDVKRVWEKGKRIFRQRTSPGANIEHRVIQVHPFILPFHNISLFYAFNMFLLRRSIRRTLRKGNYHDPVVFTSSPIVGPLIGTLGERSSHYLCLDDFTLFDGAFENLGTLEQELIAKTDSCFAISEKLLTTRKTSSRHNYFLPQGVDTVHFSPSKKRIAKTMEKISKPIIGFFGLLTTWVNIELIIGAARRYPEYQFVILGRTHVDISPLNAVRNIHYIGEVPFADLPSYARAFDVGIIPFIINDLTIACNPLKLLEYLALGIPVVSTNMPEVAKFIPHVFIADNDEEFIDSIRSAVNDISDENNAIRRAVAETLSWESIAEQISSIVNDVEATRANRRERTTSSSTLSSTISL